jgi:long-chain acyl-CoA synthetase
MIVTEGGKNIQPEPVEEVYQQHPFIHEIGVLQEGNHLVGVIVPDMEAISSQYNGDVPQALREAVGNQSRKLPTYQRIQHYALTQDPIPRTNLGKIRRHLLSDIYNQARRVA